MKKRQRPIYPRVPMPKVSAEGAERLAAWYRENAGTDLTPAEAKELLERAVRFFYLARRADRQERSD